MGSACMCSCVVFLSLKYAFVHPKSRDKVLHASGQESLQYEWLELELANVEAGRVARVSPGLVTFHGTIDDTSQALWCANSWIPTVAVSETIC